MKRRSYGDGCAVAHGLDLIGERWALLIVRDLLLGPKRFTELQAGLATASPNVLTQRLKELEDAGIVWRRTLPPPASARVYELTEWGAELQPIVGSIAKWALRSPLEKPGGPVGVDSMMLAVRDNFEMAGTGRLTVAAELDLDGLVFSLRVVDGELIELRRGELTTTPDIVIRTDSSTFGQLLDGRSSFAAATQSRDIAVEGDRRLSKRLLRAMQL